MPIHGKECEHKWEGPKSKKPIFLPSPEASNVLMNCTQCGFFSEIFCEHEFGFYGDRVTCWKCRHSVEIDRWRAYMGRLARGELT